MDLCSRSSTIASCGMINSESEKPAAMTGGDAERVLRMTCPSKRRTAGQAAAPRGVRTNPGMISFAHANKSIVSRFVWRYWEIHLTSSDMSFNFTRAFSPPVIYATSSYTRGQRAGGACVPHKAAIFCTWSSQRFITSTDTRLGITVSLSPTLIVPCPFVWVVRFHLSTQLSSYAIHAA